MLVMTSQYEISDKIKFAHADKTFSFRGLIYPPEKKNHWNKHWGTQREHSSKPLKHRIVKRILVFKR